MPAHLSRHVRRWTPYELQLSSAADREKQHLLRPNVNSWTGKRLPAGQRDPGGAKCPCRCTSRSCVATAQAGSVLMFASERGRGSALTFEASIQIEPLTRCSALAANRALQAGRSRSLRLLELGPWCKTAGCGTVDKQGPSPKGYYDLQTRH